MEITVEALKTVLDQLDDQGDEFNIISFAGPNNFTLFNDEIQPFNRNTKKAAKQWLDEQQADGGTYLLKPLFKAVTMCTNADSTLSNTIIILTDGQFAERKRIDTIIRKVSRPFLVIFVLLKHLGWFY